MTETDKADVRTIAMVLMSDVYLQFSSDTSYCSEELKFLIGYSFDKAKMQIRFK